MKNAFCFIVCTNDDLWFQECAKYIYRLFIPDGYEVSLLAITEACSMASGYNEGMHSSDAKYKIYLHQDTFIIDPYFLFHILNLFKDPSIGMFGMVGSPKLPIDGIMWHGEREGALYLQKPIDPLYGFKKWDSISYTSVDCIDGLILITQYDLEWRSDLFTGWDFYDISQCYEFRRKGYKVVIPTQHNPWVMHDAGKTLLWNYDQYRQIFLKEYEDML